jgi:alpha-galactosidase
VTTTAGAAARAVPAPDLVRVQVGTRDRWTSPEVAGVLVDVVTGEGGRSADGGSLRVDVAAERVSRVALRWRRALPPGVRVLGDAWERSYGDLAWQGLVPERPLPWSVLLHDPRTGSTEGLGVQVRGAALAFWTADPDGLTLWLDLRSGGMPVELAGGVVTAAEVVAVLSEGGAGPGGGSALTAQRELAHLQCTDPLLPPTPLVGANNWYYAYGLGFGLDAVVRDARTVSDLAGDHPVRPFAVVDDGWSAGGVADGRRASGGPWDAGRTSTFPDMAEAAATVRAQGARPGLWYRPLLRRERPTGALADAVARTPESSDGRRQDGWALDPSHPAVLDLVREDVARLRGWGFDLLKHDFSTFDLLGRWGPAMGASPAQDGLSLADPSVTTAQALVGFYRAVREAAGDVVVLGCNTVGHLAAGLQHAQRTGDDTSGLTWSRTRRTGVNTLAFRLGQHGALFAVDADCVPSTPGTPWAKNRQLLDLVARSGTALFVSVDPTTRTDAVDAELAAALRLALDGGVPGGVEPLDWLDTTTPQRWRSGAGDAAEELRLSWGEELGADPFEHTEPSPP